MVDWMKVAETFGVPAAILVALLMFLGSAAWAIGRFCAPFVRELFKKVFRTLDIVCENIQQHSISLSGIDSKMQDHGDKLAEHGEKLDEHGHKLDSHGQKLDSQGQLLVEIKKTVSSRRHPDSTAK